jgi:hypothetical protein
MKIPADGEAQPDIDPLIQRALDGLPTDFAGFDRVFQNEIRPALLSREADRIRAADKSRKATLIGGLVGVGGVLVSLFFARMPMLAILSGVVGVVYASWGGRDVGRLKKEAKTLIVEPVAKRLALSFVEDPGEVESIDRHRHVGVVPNWDRSSFEDRVTGQRNGVDFELFEAHLEQRRQTTNGKGKSQTRWVTVFRGQCLRFDFHKAFHGRTLVTRDAGFFNRFGGGGDMQRASLEDPKFEAIFEVYTTDQVESRFLLTPDLMQKLVDMEQVFHGGQLRCCFDGGEMLVTVEGGDLFEPGSMFTPLDNPDRIRELLDDFAAVFHLVDAVGHASKKRPSI